jgi:hypothetical protein
VLNNARANSLSHCGEVRLVENWWLEWRRAQNAIQQKGSFWAPPQMRHWAGSLKVSALNIDGVMYELLLPTQKCWRQP